MWKTDRINIQSVAKNWNRFVENLEQNKVQNAATFGRTSQKYTMITLNTITESM